MVIRTDIDSFSEFRIFPGRGQKFVAKDGKVFIFLTKKTKSLSLRKVKIASKYKIFLSGLILSN